MKQRVVKFYGVHPEWAMDERSKAGVDELIEMLRCILDILDQYEIESKERSGA